MEQRLNASIVELLANALSEYQLHPDEDLPSLIDLEFTWDNESETINIYKHWRFLPNTLRRDKVCIRDYSYTSLMQ